MAKKTLLGMLAERSVKSLHICHECGQVGAVIYNPYNYVVQCHCCGFHYPKNWLIGYRDTKDPNVSVP